MFLRVLFTVLRCRPVLAIMDVVVSHIAYTVAFRVRFGGMVHPENALAYRTLFPYMAAALLVLFLLYDLYSPQLRPWSEIASALATSVGLLCIITFALSFGVRAFAMPRTVVLIGAFAQLTLLSLWRYVVWFWTKRWAPVERVLVVNGTRSGADHLQAQLMALGHPVEPVARLVEEEKEAGDTYLPADQLLEAVHTYQADGVYVGDEVSPALRRRITELCVEHEIAVYLVPDLYEIVLSQSRLSHVGDTLVFNVGRLEPSMGNQVVKRLLDIAVSSVALVLAAPIMLLIAVLVALDSPGPVIYRQTRVTRGGKHFTMLKFRTMVHNAEQNTGPVMATTGDPRVTRVGRILRSTRLDELPQLVNVLMGDMSLVGPRPERPIFVSAFSREVPWYAQRLRVKPGLTGLAQVAGRYSTRVEDKLRYDLLYMCSQSLATDVKILMMTLQVVLSREKAS